ncbi:MAG: glycosyltransferase family 2 protein [Candidatus Methylomirabilales bacterium]
MGGVDISAILVNWNTRDLLLRCVTTLGSALRDHSHEVWFVDNGSQDGSVEAVRRHFPAVHIIANEDNRGYAGAVNQALACVRGRYVLLLNTDALPMADAVTHLFAFLERHPGTAAAGGQLLCPDGSRQNSVANFPSVSTELLNKSFLRMFFPRRFPGKRRDSLDPLEVESLVGACLLVRRGVIDEIGPLDERYFFFLEETDWCYRMRQAGYGIYHVPRARIYHLQGASARGFEAEARIEYHRSRLRFFKKHRGPLEAGLVAAGGMIRVGVDTVTLGILSLLPGLGKSGLRRRSEVARRLLGWYLHGCPAVDGLPGRSGGPVSDRADRADKADKANS